MLEMIKKKVKESAEQEETQKDARSNVYYNPALTALGFSG